MSDKNESYTPANPFALTTTSSTQPPVFGFQDGFKASTTPVFSSAVSPVFSITSSTASFSTPSLAVPSTMFSASFGTPAISTAAVSSVFSVPTTTAVFSSNITPSPFSSTPSLFSTNTTLPSSVFSTSLSSSATYSSIPSPSVFPSSKKLPVFSASITSPPPPVFSTSIPSVIPSMPSSNTLPVFSTQQPTTTASTALVFPPQLLPPSNKEAVSVSFGDPGNLKASTSISAGPGALDTSKHKLKVKGVPSSTIAGISHPPQTSNVNIFGGGNKQAAASVTSVFGGATKKTKDELLTEKASDMKNSQMSDAQQSSGLKKKSENDSSSTQVSSANVFAVSFGGIHADDMTSTDNVGSSLPKIFGGSSEGKGSASSHSKSAVKSLFSTIVTDDAVKVPEMKIEILAPQSSNPTEPESPDISFIEKDEPITPTGSEPKFSKKELTKIIVAMIPESCMEKEILRSHFSKFGDVIRVTLNAKVNQATVQYSNHAEASRAKRKGRKMHPNLPEVKIFYGTPIRRKSEEGSNDAMLSKKKAIKTLQHVHQSSPQPSDIDPYVPLKRPCEQDVLMPQPLLVTSTTSARRRLEVKGERHRFASKQPSVRVKLKQAEVHEKHSQADTHEKRKQEEAREKRIQAIDWHKRKQEEVREKRKQTEVHEKHSQVDAREKHKQAETREKRRHEEAREKRKQIEVREKRKQTETKVKPITKVYQKKESRVKSESAPEKRESSSVSQKYDIKSQGVDSNARYSILKERDRLVRKHYQRTSDLNKASYLLATCPDMCPELERYMRDVQYDLSSFEMTDGKLDHRLVTKKFSRSSADKEEPLPYELRPGPVLLMTIDFLICNVISRVDEEDMQLDVWYNYLWNRTRAVRNDLMQQQLTDDIAVVIMERCTRFHIYSAARLCGEPADLFDSKMNTEHLTKSLQTLKELYHDLAEKDKYFDTEPEFRAYEMLLNLNDGETIVNQYAKFREEVQKSDAVQFALKVILAVMFNNYIKFFKLIHQASYLQGCLLLRYFRQVRSKALDTMVRAYTFTGKQSIPLYTVIDRLGFENSEDARSYLTVHGVKVETDSVILDKQAFISHPDEWPVVVRPMKLVEVKRECSVSEVIQGGPLPDNPLFTHVPHTSFTPMHFLKPGSRDASDQMGKHQIAVDVTGAPVTKPETHQNYQKDVYTMIESSVLSEMLKQLCGDVVKKMTVIKETGSRIYKEVLETAVALELKNLSQEVYSEVEKEEKERIRLQREREEKERRLVKEIYERISVSIHAQYSEQIIQEQIIELCKETMKEMETEVAVRELLEEIPQRCISEVLVTECKQISKNAIDVVTEELEENIRALQRSMNRRMMGGVFKAWHKQAQRSRRRKQSQETFPAICSQLTLRQQNEALGWGYQRQRNEDMTIVKLNKVESELNVCLEKAVLTKKLMRECAWMPFPLQSKLTEEVNKLAPVSMNVLSQYFKVLVCGSSSASPIIRHWVRTKLGFEEKENLEEQSTQCLCVVSRKTGLEYGWVIKEVTLNSISVEDLRGTSLVLFISSDLGTQDSEYHKLKHLTGKLPQVSCTKIFFESKSTEQDSWILMEEDLLKPEVSERLQSVLFKSWHQLSNTLTVTCSSLNSFISGEVAKKYVEPVLITHSERTTEGKSPMSPSILIDLFNTVITFLIKVVDDNDVKNLDWPPPELNHMHQIPSSTWNNTDITNIIRMLNNTMLPKFNLEGVSTWKCINEAIHSYAVKVAGQQGNATVILSHLHPILLNTQKILEPVFGSEDEDFADCKLHVLQLPWTELIYACVSYRLSQLPNTKVFYQAKRLGSFVFPASWWSASDVSDVEWARAVMDTSMNSSRKRKAETVEQALSNQSKVQRLPTKLLTDLGDEKQKCADLLKKTESSLLEFEEELKFLFGESF